MANVTLRHKKITKDRLSLYLDYYPEIVHPKTGKSTRREFLKLYVYENPNTDLEKAHNKETIKFAELIRSKRLLQIRDREFGFKENVHQNINFVSFYEHICDDVLNKTTHKNFLIWKASLNYFKHKFGENLKTSQLNQSHVKEYRAFLLSTDNLRNKHQTKLSVNTAATYYKKFVTVLKEAYKRRLTEQDLSEFAQYIKEEQSFREYLNEYELSILWQTPIKEDYVKHMAIFSALTGLRFVDINALQWNSIFTDSHQGAYIKLKEKKTKGVSNLPISESAFNILKIYTKDSGKIFPDIKYSQIVRPLTEWIKNSKINKKITFHNFRHSFATLQLANGTDIYTVSKLLGHKNVSTTQIYTKVMDKNKVEAVNRINIDLDGL